MTAMLRLQGLLLPPSLLQEADSRGVAGQPDDETPPSRGTCPTHATASTTVEGSATRADPDSTRRRRPCRGDEIAGRYRLTRLLAEGGMGSVWAAHDLALGRRVALKLLKDDGTPECQLQMLRRELRAACAVVHPNVVQMYQIIEPLHNAPAMVMEYLEGESLGDRLDRLGSMSLTDLAPIMQQVVSAVGAAHARGVVHRDLKPDNIFLTEGRRGVPEVKILDFGIAKLTLRESASARSQPQSDPLSGTPCYMAPEQLFGEAGVDHGVDVWSLGLVCYEALSGILPTEADNVLRVIQRIATAPIPSLRRVASELPDEVVELVDRMVCRDRARRPQDLREVRRLLACYTEVGTPAFGAPAGHGGGPRNGSELATLAGVDQGKALPAGGVCSLPATDEPSFTPAPRTLRNAPTDERNDRARRCPPTVARSGNGSGRYATLLLAAALSAAGTLGVGAVVAPAIAGQLGRNAAARTAIDGATAPALATTDRRSRPALR